jgi:hypothetical protein
VWWWRDVLHRDHLRERARADTSDTTSSNAYGALRHQLVRRDRPMWHPMPKQHRRGLPERRGVLRKRRLHTAPDVGADAGTNIVAYPIAHAAHTESITRANASAHGIAYAKPDAEPDAKPHALADASAIAGPYTCASALQHQARLLRRTVLRQRRRREPRHVQGLRAGHLEHSRRPAPGRGAAGASAHTQLPQRELHGLRHRTCCA